MARAAAGSLERDLHDAPYELLLEFLQATYVAAANLAKWDRAALERG